MESKSSNNTEKSRYRPEKEINPKSLELNIQEKTINLRSQATIGIG